MNDLGISMLLVAGGLAIVILILVFTRRLPGWQRQAQQSMTMSLAPSRPVSPEIHPTSDALLIVQPGGRVVYSNTSAQEWFGYQDQQPNLERLARKARPSEIFLGLCASEGRARFSLDGRLVEGRSFYVPYSPQQIALSALNRPLSPHLDSPASSLAMLVTLHQVQVSFTGKPRPGDTQPGVQISSGSSLEIFNELNQLMTANLELEKTLSAILESVERLVSADFVEITRWDAAHKQLIPYRFVGSDDQRRLEKPAQRYPLGPDGQVASYTGYLVSQRLPLRVDDVDGFRDVRPAVDRQQYPFNSYLGVPLLLAGELVGTLELAALRHRAFTPADQEILSVLAGQAAIALNNAVLFEAEQRRKVEYAGLARLAGLGERMLSASSQEAQDLYARLVEVIGGSGKPDGDAPAPLLAVKTLGFLTYNEPNHMLEAQPPFLGIPDQMLDLYCLPVSPGSPAEALWLSGELLFAADAAHDPQMAVLGFDHMAVAAGIQQCVLAPLVAGGQRLGYLQCADKLDGSFFEPDDFRLIEIISSQAAAILANTTLAQQNQMRAQRSEALRRIASLAGSNAMLDEILSYSVLELARLFRADAATLMLFDENLGELHLHRPSFFGVSLEAHPELAHLMAPAQSLGEMVTGSNQPLLVENLLTSTRLENDLDPVRALAAYRPLLDLLGARSILVAPLVERDTVAGELLLTSAKPALFDRSALALVSTAANQLGGAIERARLYTQTDESLRRRVAQLLALTRISRELNTTLDLQRVLGLVYDEILKTTHAPCGSIILLDRNSQPGAPQAVAFALGDAAQSDWPGPSELERKVIDEAEPATIADYAVDGIDPPHTAVRSALFAPIGFRGNVAGLISLHSLSPDFFDQTAVEIVQSLAVQAAIALGNAYSYQDQLQRSDLLNRRVETMTALLETSRSLQAGQPLAESLETIAYAIQNASPFSVVLISVFEPSTNLLQRTAAAGVPLTMMNELKQHPQPWESVQALLQNEFRLGNSYLIPFDRAQVIINETNLNVAQVLPTLDGSAERYNQPASWHPEDMCLAPLYRDERLVGLISVDAPRDGLRPDRQTIDALEIFASQAAFVIDTYARISALERSTSQLQSDLLLSRQSAEQAEAQLPGLLGKDQEQTQALQELNRRARQLSACLAISEQANRLENRSDILQVLGSGLLTGMELDTVLIAVLSQGSPRLLHALGNIPPGVNLQALLGQRSPLRLALQNGQALYQHNLAAAPEGQEWQNTPLLANLEAQAFFCWAVPGGGVSGSEPIEAAVLGISRAPLPPFSAEDQQMFTRLANQISFTLLNLALVAETNRSLMEMNLLLEFSRQLGSPDPASLLRTLLSSVKEIIPAVDAGVACLWVDEESSLRPLAALGYPDNERMLQMSYKAGEALPGRVYVSGQVERIAELNFATQYALPAASVLVYRDATAGRLPVASLAVPLSAQSERASASNGGQVNLPSVLGVLVLDNFKTPGAFAASDQNLVAAMARQAALTLENVRLYQATEARSAQMEALAKAAGEISANLDVTSLYATLLERIQTILPHDTATLWMRAGTPGGSPAQRTTFVVQAAQMRAPEGYAVSQERLGQSVALADSRLLTEMTANGQPVVVQDVRQDTRFPTLVEAEYLSWLSLPLMAQGEVAGVLVLEKREANYFSPDRVQVMVAFASQAASALENARLYTDSQRRAQELDQRSRRLALLNRLSNALSETLDLEKILPVASRELLQALPGETERAVSIVVLNERTGAQVRAEQPLRSPALPAPLPDNPLFARLRETQGVFISEDVSQDSELEPLQAYLAAFETRSLLALPLASGADLLGIALLQTNSPYRFTPDEIELSRTIANQVGAALQNARLFAETERLFGETQQRSAELSALFDLGVNLTQVRAEQRLLDLTFDQVVRLLKPDAVLVALLRGENQLEINVYEDGARQPQLTIDRSGGSYSEYVIQSNRPLLLKDTHAGETPVSGIRLGVLSCACWLGVPLVARGAPTGVLSVQSYTPNAYDEDDLRLVEQVANQLSVAIDNAQLFGQVESYAADLEQRVNERTDQLAREHRRIQSLLAITTELSASLDLDLVLNRTLKVINETVGAEHASILLNQLDSPYLLLRASSGYMGEVPKGGVVSTMKRSEGLAGWVIASRQAVMVEDVWADPRWIPREDGTRQHRSALAIPLQVGEEILGALMLYNRESNSFLADQLDLMQATAKQIAVAINNAQLYSLIRDQAERLGDMLRSQHIETSRSQAILEAVADGVLVTDARRLITLFNASAEQILGLKRGEVLGRSLMHFGGLFGAAGQEWFQTIEHWSENPRGYQPGDTYEQQIVLDNRRVIAVHLSPVRLRNDFLGTVSIFRDITHQVEVDRLKSEFVATVSHELRTPMTSIKGYVDIMLMGAAGSFTPQQVRFLEVVKTNTERLAILVNDLLDVSRIEAGKIDLSLQPLDLRQLVDDVLGALKRRMEMEGRQMEVHREAPANLPLVHGDRSRILQVLENLVGNAYQYTLPGGKIEIALCAAGDAVQVDVRDSGIGIRAEDRGRIFERFFRGHDPLVYASSGNGLGLSIAKTMVEMHNGRIWFDSSGEPGEGSTFSFTLPVYTADAAPDGALQSNHMKRE